MEEKLVGDHFNSHDMQLTSSVLLMMMIVDTGIVYESGREGKITGNMGEHEASVCFKMWMEGQVSAEGSICFCLAAPSPFRWSVRLVSGNIGWERSQGVLASRLVVRAKNWSTDFSTHALLNNNNNNNKNSWFA